MYNLWSEQICLESIDRRTTIHSILSRINCVVNGNTTEK